MKSSRLLLFMLMLLLIPAVAFSQGSLAGRRIVVRRYNQLEKNPQAYEGLVTTIGSGGIEIQPVQIPDAGALVLTATDQSDPDVKALLQGGVYSVEYRDGFINSGTGLQPVAQHKPALVEFGAKGNARIVRKIVLDALGKPMLGANVEYLLKHGAGSILVTQLQTDAEGAIEYPSAHGLYHPQLVVRDERYLAAVVPTWSDGPCPLVAADSPAAERALSGRIFDSSGKPADGALIKLSHLRTPGQGMIDVAFNCQAMTNHDGRFRIYPIWRNKKIEDAELIPPGCLYFISVEVPSDPGQPELTYQLRSGSEAEVRMISGDRARRFRFEDANGKALDPAKIENVIIQGPSQSQRYTLAEATAGRRFIPGKYEAWLIPEPKFEPVTIDAKSPETVVFRVPGSISYEGRVVDAISGRPLPGALVFLMTMQVSDNWHDLTPQQWQAIHSLPAQPKLDDPALAPMRAGGRPALVRADADGRYRIPAPSGLVVHSIGAVEENYLLVEQAVHSLKPDARGMIAVKDFGLVPAAIASVKVIGPNGERVGVTPLWEMNRDSLTPKWKEALFGAGVGSDIIYPYQYRSTGGSFPIPAGVPFSLKLRPGFRTHVASVHVAGPIQATPGQKVDLGELKASKMALVTVQIVGPDDAPVEGVSVRNMITENGRRFGLLPSSTDAQGLAFLDVEPGTEGTIMVMRGAEISYKCPAGAAEMPIQILKLTAEQMAALQQLRSGRPPARAITK